jgi:hypothetical protein
MLSLTFRDLDEELLNRKSSTFVPHSRKNHLDRAREQGAFFRNVPRSPISAATAVSGYQSLTKRPVSEGKAI